MNSPVQCIGANPFNDYILIELVYIYQQLLPGKV